MDGLGLGSESAVVSAKVAAEDYRGAYWCWNKHDRVV
jgi:hypothetical protein